MPIKPYKSKFIFQKDEWCYEPSKLKMKDWPKYLLYAIYEIWYQFFSFCIHFYEKETIEQLMDFAIYLLEDLIQRKKITPTRNLFSKMFKACGRNELSSYLKKILTSANTLYKKSGTSIFQNAYLNGLYTLVDSGSSVVNFSVSYTVYNDINAKRNFLDEINNIDYYSYFDDFLFLTEKYCPYCTKNVEKIKFITMEELLAGFNQNINKFESICPNCLTVINSNIYYLSKNDKKISIQQFQLLKPNRLLNEVDEIMKDNGEYFFYLKNFYDNQKAILVYINIIFYFKLFDLPLFVLCIERDKIKFKENILKEIQENINRKNILKEKRPKSPDKKKNNNNSQDKSLSYVSSTTEDNSTVISSKSNSSTGKGQMEYELWKEVYLNNKDKIKLSGDLIGTENKSDLFKRIKYMKSVLNDITSYFNSSYREKLNEFLENHEFKNEIKEENKIIENPFKPMNKIKKESIDKNKYQGLSSDEYFKNDNDININYGNTPFEAIANENLKYNEKKLNKSSQNMEIPSGFDQINQLKDDDSYRESKGIGNKIKKIFSNFK